MALVKTTIADESESFETSISSAETSDFIICKNADKLEALIAMFRTGSSVHYVSSGYWSTHDLILSLINEMKPAELFLTTYALREFPVRQLIQSQQRNEITGINMLIDYRAKVRTPEVFQLAELNVNRIYLTSIHAKVFVLKSADKTATVVGSANLTQNPRIEAGVLTANPSVAEFHIKWIENIMSNAEIFT